MKFALLTFGCRVNLADSLSFERQLRADGGELCSVETAEVVFVNTCAVTGQAEQAARQAIRRAARLNPTSKLVVTGCYATRHARHLASLPGVVRVVPNDDKGTLAAAFESSDEGRTGAGPTEPVALPRPGILGRTVYTLRVQTGCDESCSYCIVPATRGPGRSTAPAVALAEIERVRAAGFREVMVTGVHLGSYGRDLAPRSSLAALLKDVAVRSPGGFLVRIGSIEPMDVTPGVEDALAGGRPFAPHFHLPLQHASDRMLRAMKRRYTLESYAQLVGRLRRHRPDAAIGTDVIVGFPGEQQEDVDLMAAYLRESPLTYVHVFPYSPRPGTLAEALPHRVPGTVARRRRDEIRAIASMLAARFRASQIGSVRDGLTTEDGSLVVTDNYLKVRVRAGAGRNSRVRVRIAADGMPMRGEIVSVFGDEKGDGESSPVSCWRL